MHSGDQSDVGNGGKLSASPKGWTGSEAMFGRTSGETKLKTPNIAFARIVF